MVAIALHLESKHNIKLPNRWHYEKVNAPIVDADLSEGVEVPSEQIFEFT
jgi:hypothetical protein